MRLSLRGSVAILLTLSVLVGIPLGIVAYESYRTGMTWTQVLGRMTARSGGSRAGRSSGETDSSASLPKGEKIDFLVPRPIGNLFQEPPRISNVQAVDLDQDGLLDVVVCDCQAHTVSWIRQYPRDVFTESVCAADLIAPAHVEAIDFDADGDLDLLVAVLGMLFPNNDRIGSVVVLENDGQTEFQKHVVVERVARVSDVRGGDLDGDGDMDLAVAQFGYDDGQTRWIENLGEWSFESHVLQSRSGPIHSPIGDMDGDGDLDIVVLVSQEWEEIYVFEGDGKGGFKPRQIFASDNQDYGSSGLWLADLDQDGDQDVLYRCARRRGRAQAQRELVAHLRSIGGRVYYDYQCDESKEWPLDEEGLPRPGWLEDLLGEDFLHQVSYVSFVQFERRDGGLLAVETHYASDAELARLAELPNLRWLALDGRRLTDAGLEHLPELTRLERLWLTETLVSDAWVAHLDGLANLRQLFLPCTRVTDAGLKHLRGLPLLERLDLSGTHATDAGLANLEGMSNLRTLLLDGTRVTDAGMDRLNGLANLDLLSLAATGVGDAGLARLDGLSRLRELRLYESRCTLSGVVHLYTVLQGRSLDEVWEAAAETERDDDGQVVSLDHLGMIDLTGTRVTDAGLDKLRGLSNLRTLHLAGTQVTSEGVANLERASSHGIRVHRIDLSYMKSDQRSPKNASSNVNLANALMSQGRIEEARVYFLKAIEHQPNRKEAHFGLARILGGEWKLEEAAARYREALRIDPSYFEAHLSLGLLLLNAGRLDESRRSLAAAVRLKPNDPPANYYYGHVLHRLGELEQAADHYQLALNRDPEFVTALLALAAIRIARDHPDLHDPVEAVKCAERACELTQQKDPNALEILSKIYAGAGRLDDAVDTAARALDIARNMGDKTLADRIEKNVALYRRIVTERQDP